MPQPICPHCHGYYLKTVRRRDRKGWPSYHCPHCGGRVTKSRSVNVSKDKRMAIYERDRWICQLCLEPVDRELTGTNAPMAPSLDHRIHRARGGKSTYENLVLAHRECNSRRDKIELDRIKDLV